MIIIPAIDIINGECVRLYQGKEEEKTVFSPSPVQVAKKWKEQGARLIHVVDLDGAFSGAPQNLSTILHIIQEVGIAIELGGGIRTSVMAKKLLTSGVNSVILGTIAFMEPQAVKSLCQKFPNRISIGIDVKDGKIAIRGWKDTIDSTALEFCQQLDDWGVRNIIFTDIKTDGTLKGPNIEAVKRLLQKVNLPVIASGGISNMEDLAQLAKLEPLGLEGVIIGKALYTKDIDLQQAIDLYQSNNDTE